MTNPNSFGAPEGDDRIPSPEAILQQQSKERLDKIRDILEYVWEVGKDPGLVAEINDFREHLDTYDWQSPAE